MLPLLHFSRGATRAHLCIFLVLSNSCNDWCQCDSEKDVFTHKPFRTVSRHCCDLVTSDVYVWVVPFQLSDIVYKQDYVGIPIEVHRLCNICKHGWGRGPQCKVPPCQKHGNSPIRDYATLNYLLTSTDYRPHKHLYLKLVCGKHPRFTGATKSVGSSCDNCFVFANATWIHLSLVYFLCIYIYPYMIGILSYEGFLGELCIWVLHSAWFWNLIKSNRRHLLNFSICI